MRGSSGGSFQENIHGLNGLISQFPHLNVSRRDRCKERHPGHPGGTTEAAAQPSECGRQHTLNSVHGHTAARLQSNGNLSV